MSILHLLFCFKYLYDYPEINYKLYTGHYYSPTDQYQYQDLGKDVSQIKSLAVRIQRCHNGHVAVTETRGVFVDYHLYEFVFGG